METGVHMKALGVEKITVGVGVTATGVEMTRPWDRSDDTLG